MSELDDLRKQIPPLLWNAFEAAFDRGLKENPEIWSESDRLSYMADLVNKEVKSKSGGLERLAIALHHGLDLEQYSKAVRGKFNWDTDTLEINKLDSEILCDRLIDELKKHNESETSAPVRHGSLMPKSFITATAMEMLRTYSAKDESPPVYLVELFGQLLDETAYGTREHRAPYQREWAAVLLARDPKIKNRPLAQAVGVSTATVSSWKNDPLFLGLVDALRDNPKMLLLHEEFYRENQPPTK